MFVSGCASTETSKQELSLKPDMGMPAAGKSKVIFFRPTNYGGDLNFGVHDGRQLIGRVSGLSYFTYECELGHHVFSTSMENLAFLDADLLPDRIYYVCVHATMGWVIARVKMDAIYPGCSEMNWEKMPNTLVKLEKTTVDDYAVKQDTLRIRGYTERLQKYQNEAGTNAFRILPEYGQTAPLYSQ